MSGPILITSATGRQGRATIRALLALPSPPKTILAVTRSAASAGAQKLASSSPSIKLVEGTLDDVPTLFKTAKEIAGESIWGVLSVQLPQGMGTTNEAAQGKAMVDEALSHHVKHFVYSSLDRGGEEHSWNNPTKVPHFATKHEVELYLREKAKDTQMTWTILRPVAFMDNLEPGMQTRVFLAALKITVPAQKKIQWIAARDIGIVAAKAFTEPESFAERAIGLAGNEMTLAELSETFGVTTGKALTPTWSLFGYLLKWFVAELGAMVDWFGQEGFGVDIKELRKIHPGLTDLKTWIAEESAFVARK